MDNGTKLLLTYFLSVIAGFVTGVVTDKLRRLSQ